jgi:hypothetical protein
MLLVDELLDEEMLPSSGRSATQNLAITAALLLAPVSYENVFECFC